MCVIRRRRYNPTVNERKWIRVKLKVQLEGPAPKDKKLVPEGKMDGRFQQHQSDSFSIANLLSMQPKHNHHHHHHPHRVIHPDPLSHLRKLTTLPDAAETNALLAIHQHQHQHYHHHPPAPSYFCTNPAIPSTSGHPSLMTPPGATASQPEAFKVEESMMMSSSEVHHQSHNEAFHFPNLNSMFVDVIVLNTLAIL